VVYYLKVSWYYIGLNALVTPYVSKSCNFDPLKKKDILTP